MCNFNATYANYLGAHADQSFFSCEAWTRSLIKLNEDHFTKRKGPVYLPTI